MSNRRGRNGRVALDIVRKSKMVSDIDELLGDNRERLKVALVVADH